MIDEIFWNLFWIAIVISLLYACGRWQKATPNKEKVSNEEVGPFAFVGAYSFNAFLLFSLAWNITQVVIFVVGSYQ